MRSPWCWRRRLSPGQRPPAASRPGRAGGVGGGQARRGRARRGAGSSREEGRDGEPPPPALWSLTGAGEVPRCRPRPGRSLPTALPPSTEEATGLGLALRGSAARGRRGQPVLRCHNASWLVSAPHPPPRHPARPAGSKPALASVFFNLISFFLAFELNQQQRAAGRVGGFPPAVGSHSPCKEGAHFWLSVSHRRSDRSFSPLPLPPQPLPPGGAGAAPLPAPLVPGAGARTRTLRRPFRGSRRGAAVGCQAVGGGGTVLFSPWKDVSSSWGGDC